MVEEKKLDVIEYGIFGAMLSISVLLGIYFGCIKKQTSVSEYLQGNRELSLIPVSLSLTASYVSSFCFIVIPSEIYTYGTPYALSIIANLASGLITAEFFLPVFYGLRLNSNFEYLELRFGKHLRTFTSFLYDLLFITYLPVVIYGPALAVNQVSGLNTEMVAVTLAALCIFYTLVGGIKAVVWTDAVQIAFMTGAIILLSYLGIAKAGGILKVIDNAHQGDRIDLFNFSLDPTERLSLWTGIFGLTVTWTGYLAVQPGFLQRFNSLPTFQSSKRSVWIMTVGICLFQIPCMFIGLVIYTLYGDCDPLLTKLISSYDQIMPFFIMNIGGHLKGLTGLFLVGVCSASMSTLSTSLNAIAGTIYGDFIMHRISKETEISKGVIILKTLVLVVGCCCLLLVFVIDKLGSLMEICLGIGGAILGSVTGVFTLGLLFPSANSFGATVGGATSFLITTWLLVGNTVMTIQGFTLYPMKPLSTSKCSFNTTSQISFAAEDRDQVWAPYRISIFLYGLIGCSISVFLGLAVSHLKDPLKPGDVDRRLLSPLIHRFLPPDNTNIKELSVRLRLIESDVKV